MQLFQFAREILFESIALNLGFKSNDFKEKLSIKLPSNINEQYATILPIDSIANCLLFGKSIRINKAMAQQSNSISLENNQIRFVDDLVCMPHIGKLSLFFISIK